jgi:hypothetical protein
VIHHQPPRKEDVSIQYTSPSSSMAAVFFLYSFYLSGSVIDLLRALLRVDTLLNVFAGRETQLLKELCEKYKVDGGPEVQAFEKQINDLRLTAVSELFRLLNERAAQLEFVVSNALRPVLSLRCISNSLGYYCACGAQVEVQMFQLYRDGLDDLLKENKKPAKGEGEKKPTPLKITLAEHSPTGLAIVSVPHVLRVV